MWHYLRQSHVLAGPETPEGQLSASSLDLIGSDGTLYCLSMWSRYGAWIRYLGLVKGLIRSQHSLLLDADALQPEILPALKLRFHSMNSASVILTPHLGEYRRLSQPMRWIRKLQASNNFVK